MDCRRVSRDRSRQKCRMGGSGTPGMRPPRIVPLRGLSRQLEQSLRVFQRGLRSANRRLEGRAEKRAFLRECGFKRRLAALGSESVYETSTSMRPGWLAWAAFIFAGKIVATDFTDQDLSEEVRERFRSHASRLMFAFISPILRINEAALDNPVFATQVEHRKN